MSGEGREERVESRENRIVCVVCKKDAATQKHHISYKPELLIDICVPCHMLVHQHGVGKPCGNEEKPLDDRLLVEEKILQLPIFTKIKTVEETPYIVTVADEMVLISGMCPNCETKGQTWQILVHPDTLEAFSRCPQCGYDLKMNFLNRDEKEVCVCERKNEKETGQEDVKDG